MSDGAVIKFNTAKKALKKVRAEQQAAENRVKFGRTKVQKAKDLNEKTQSARNIDAHKRSPD